MSPQKQVDRGHYEFGRYMSKARWNSVWHQIDEIQRLKVASVLEIGPGPGLFKSIIKMSGIEVETLDLDPDLNPDHVGSVTAIPLLDDSYDAVCAFQMLEHLPYDEALVAFGEMVRVSGRHVVISLPDARHVWRYSIRIPTICTLEILVPRPQIRVPIHEFDGEHHWEINKRNFPLKRIISDFSNYAKLTKTYRVLENPYHRFFVFSTSQATCSGGSPAHS